NLPRMLSSRAEPWGCSRSCAVAVVELSEFPGAASSEPRFTPVQKNTPEPDINMTSPRPSSLVAKSLAALVCATGLASAVQAATVGYWRFEQDALLSDSGPNNIGLFQFNHPTTGVQNPLPTQIALPSTGAGSGFAGM